jgi:hypothetical protein
VGALDAKQGAVSSSSPVAYPLWRREEVARKFRAPGRGCLGRALALAPLAPCRSPGTWERYTIRSCT